MNRVLLYGATGYSGRLIAQAAAQRRSALAERDVELVLGARDRRALDELARATGFQRTSFALDDRPTVLDALRNFKVVLNAAGPFAATAPRLARSALEVDCDYVDLGGEVDVYRALDDLGPIAMQRRVGMLCGAGRISFAADLVLTALLRVPLKGRLADVRTLRIAHSNVKHLSRGSLRTSLRAIREQVTVIRSGRVHHVPVGQLERTFDFDVDGDRPERRQSLASAASFLDTLVANTTARREECPELDIESYMEMDTRTRLTYQLASAGSGLLNLPGMQTLSSRQLDLLPQGPDEEQRQENHQVMRMEVEDGFREVIASAPFGTPDPYEFSARTALFATIAMATADVSGWLTPAQVFEVLDKPLRVDLLAGCRISDELRAAMVDGVAA